MSKKCTPLWHEAHFQVKMLKTPGVRTTFGSWDVEKVHAVVVRSTFPSQNVKNTRGSDHFWKLTMSKKCTPLWCEAHFQVKMLKTPGVRTAFGGSDVEKVHAVVARSTFPSQNAQNTPGPDHFWQLRCTLHYTTGHYTTLHSSTLHCTKLHYTTLHYTTLRSTTLHYTISHYTTLHSTTLHYTILHNLPLHFTTLHYTTLHYTTTTTTTTQLHAHYTPLHSITLHYTKLHYTTLHYTTLHSATLHYTTLHSATLHYTEWHCTTDRR